MVTKRIAKKHAKKELDPLETIAKRLSDLEIQLKEKDEKLKALDLKDKNKGIGDQKFGKSGWEDMQRGNEKGYYQSYYIDITSLVPQNGRYF